ncbi:MAG: hypothetical protein ACTHU0_12715 [Kofleriaceae bacterium]
MPAPSQPSPCVLVVADPDRAIELVAALSEPLPTTVVSKLEVLTSDGGDDTVDLFAARRPAVVVVTATLDDGDTGALVDALRGMVPRGELSVIVIGDPNGPIRTALDAIDLAPDRFVSRPLSPRALRFAVASGLEAAMLVRESAPPAAAAAALDAAVVAAIDDDPTESTRAALRKRWEALADSMAGDPDEDGSGEADESGSAALAEEAAPLPPPLSIRPRWATGQEMDVAPPQAWRPGTTADVDRSWADLAGDPGAPPVALGSSPGWIASGAEPDPEPPVREPTLIIPDPIGPRESQPSAFDASPIHPPFGERRESQPSFGPRESQPSFGASRESQPSFGPRESQRLALDARSIQSSSGDARASTPPSQHHASTPLPFETQDSQSQLAGLRSSESSLTGLRSSELSLAGLRSRESSLGDGR